MNGQTLVEAYVPLPGGAKAVYTSSGLTYYYHADWLGSSRLASRPDRTPVYSLAYSPYGEAYPSTGSVESSFTGQFMSTMAGLYDFAFRRYSPSSGRWMSPDPSGVAASDPWNPQSWNRYTYVTNKPLTTVDPNGLDGIGINCNYGPVWGAPFWWSFPGGSQYVCVDLGRALPIDVLNNQLNQIQLPTGDFGHGDMVILPQPPLRKTIWEDLLGLPHVPTMEEIQRGWILMDATRETEQDDNAIALANAVNKTGVQTIANPCTPAYFYGASYLYVASPTAELSSVAKIGGKEGLFAGVKQLNRIVGKWAAAGGAAIGYAYNWWKENLVGVCNAMQ